MSPASAAPVYVMALPPKVITTVHLDPRVAALPAARTFALAAEVLQDMNTDRAASVVIDMDGADAVVATLPRTYWQRLYECVPEGAEIVVRAASAGAEIVVRAASAGAEGTRFDRRAFRELLF